MADKRKRKEEVAELLTYPQAAKVMGVTTSAICQAVKRGRLSVVRFGHVVLVTRISLKEYSSHKLKPGKKPQKK